MRQRNKENMFVCVRACKRNSLQEELVHRLVKDIFPLGIGLAIRSYFLVKLEHPMRMIKGLAGISSLG